MNKTNAYHLLSDLIYKGFLTIRMKIADKTFVFKTVNEKEYDLIKLYSGFSNDSDYTLRFNLNFLVFSTLLINGENFLLNRDEKLLDCYDFFSKLPYQFHIKIMKELSDLKNVAFDCANYIEGFSYTEQSRKRWLFVDGFPNNRIFTGIPGTDFLGLNVYQESWLLINKMLDKEEIYNKDFSLAVLISSASNPKGARGVRGKHDAAVQRVEERRKKLAKKGSHKTQSWSPEGWAAPVDTAEELVAELMRQMEGKKDKHDLFIDEYMKKLREKAEEQSRQAEERIQKLREKREKEGDIPAITGTQRVLTPEEMQDLVPNNSNNLVIVESGEEASKEEEDRFYKKVSPKIIKGRK